MDEDSSFARLESALDRARRALAERYPEEREDDRSEAGGEAPPQRVSLVLACLRERDDRAFVYRALLTARGRPPGASEFGAWLSALRSGRTDRHGLLDAMLEEAETGGVPQPDPGAALWISRDLFHISEFVVLGPPQFLTAAFCACLKRPPDAFSTAYHLPQLEAGTVDRREILRLLLASEEARYRSIGCVVLGLEPADSGAERLATALAELHARHLELEHLTAALLVERSFRNQSVPPAS